MEDEQITITRHYIRYVLRRYRDKADLSMHQLADRVGISKGFYASMESGKKWPNIDMLIRIAHALNVRPGELLDALMAEWEKAGGRLY